MPEFFAALMQLIAKDLRVSVRRWYELASLAIVSVVIGLAVAYTVSSPVGLAVEAEAAALVFAVGQLLTLFIAAVAAAYLSVIREAEKGTLDGIRASPVPPEAVYLAKAVYSLVVMLVLALSYALTASAFSSSTLILNPYYLTALLASTLYFAAASALTAFLIVYSESRSLLSTVVLAGLVTPYIQNSIQVLSLSALGSPASPTNAALLSPIALLVLASMLSRPLTEI